MGYTLAYEGAMVGATIAAAMNSASGAVVIPSANGQRVIVLQGAQ